MKIIRCLAVLLIVASVGAAFLGWQKAAQLQRANDALRAETQALQGQRAAEDETRSKQRDREVERLRAEAQEVHRLRNEVSQLRSGAKAAQKLVAENQQLRATPATAPA